MYSILLVHFGGARGPLLPRLARARRGVFEAARPRNRSQHIAVCVYQTTATTTTTTTTTTNNQQPTTNNQQSTTDNQPPTTNSSSSSSSNNNDAVIPTTTTTNEYKLITKCTSRLKDKFAMVCKLSCLSHVCVGSTLRSQSAIGCKRGRMFTSLYIYIHVFV